MVDLGAVHSMLIEMHGGMLTLAAVCILATVVARVHKRYGILWPIDSLVGTLARYTEPTAYLAGIGGVIGLIASAVVGFYVWPIEAITTSAVGLSKVMFSVFATELWIIFVFIRSKYGENLWKNSGMAAVYACSGIFGFLFMVLTGSFGGHMAGKGSVLDPVYALLGVNPEAFWVIGSDFVPFFVSIAFVEIAVLITVFLYLQLRARLKDGGKT